MFTNEKTKKIIWKKMKKNRIFFYEIHLSTAFYSLEAHN